MGTSIPASGGGGQDPSNVAITGGAITGVSLYGDTAATWIARAGYLDNFDRFKRSAYASMIASDPTLTGFGYAKLGLVPAAATFGAFTNDASIEGGGITPPTGTQLGFGATVFQNMQLGHWALFWEGKATPNQTAQFGAQKVDASFGIWIGTFATDATHFHVRIFNGGGTDDLSLSTADTANHIFGLVDNGTIITPYIDGVAQATTLPRTRLASGASQLYFYNTTAGQIQIKNCAWGYVTS